MYTIKYNCKIINYTNKLDSVSIYCTIISTDYEVILKIV